MRHIVFIQHGDFGAAVHHFAAGGEEQYRDQRRSVAFVQRLAETAPVTVVCLGTVTQSEELSPNLTALHVAKAELTGARAAALLRDLVPSHLILRTPHLGFLREAVSAGTPVLPCFADMFDTGGPRRWLAHRRLAAVLKACNAPCVCNHSLNASRSMIGALDLSADRIVPWDWSPVPVNPSPPSSFGTLTEPRLFFAGAMTEAKGLSDLIRAVALLVSRGIAAHLAIAGPGDTEGWSYLAQDLELGGQVRCLGRIANAQVRQHMAQSDFVVVPSRHNYPEGLPNVIYEALAARSVLVVSDHPAFVGRLLDGQTCLMFRAGAPEELAVRIATACSDPDLRRHLSEAAGPAHDELYVGLEWTELMQTFLDDPEDRTGWVKANALSDYL
jgi:glycosyltransferase involved in cell wall biosynthesis